MLGSCLEHFTGYTYCKMVLNENGTNGCGFGFDPSPCLLPARRPSIPPSVRSSLPPSIPNHSRLPYVLPSLCPSINPQSTCPSLCPSIPSSQHPHHPSLPPSPYPSILPSLNPFQYSSVHHSLTVQTKPTQNSILFQLKFQHKCCVASCHHAVTSFGHPHMSHSVTNIAVSPVSPPTCSG